MLAPGPVGNRRGRILAVGTAPAGYPPGMRAPRAMFVLYLALVVLGLALYITLGLAGR
jgi:hypothetical protein